MSITITERGWPGHFIAAFKCRFRRNTLVDVGEGCRAVVVSTVGNYWPTPNHQEQIGGGYYYETHVFEANGTTGATGRFVARTKSNGLEGLRNLITEMAADIEANEMHERHVAAVAKWLAAKAKKGAAK